jgi:hypothetical protein
LSSLLQIEFANCELEMVIANWLGLLQIDTLANKSPW